MSALAVRRVIHMDPVNLKDPEMKEKRAATEALVKEIDSRLTIHDFRLVHGGGVTKILFDVVVPFEMKRPEEELKARIQDSVSRTMENCAALINVDHSYV